MEILENKTEKIEVKIEKIEVKETPSSILTTNNQSSTGSEISIEENKNNHRGTNKQEIINGYSILISLFILAGLS
jgi:hypothetical protein